MVLFPRQGNLTKGVGFCLLICFGLTSSISYAQEVDFARSFSSKEFHAPDLLNKIEVPAELGQITKSIPSKSSAGLLVHIQDAHAQLDAQKNIQGLLAHLKDRYGLSTVFLEGGLSGKISPDLLRFFKDENTNKRIAGHLLKEGVIGGPEQFLLNANGTHAYGVEQLALYKENLESFRRVYSKKNETDRFLNRFKTQIITFASRELNPRLRKFLKEWLLYQDSKQDIFGHLNDLDAASRGHLNLDLHDARNQMEYPQLIRLFKLKEMEGQIRPETAEIEKQKERRKFIHWLGAHKINPALKEQARMLLYQNEQGDLRSFLEQFYEAAKPEGFSFKDYPVLSRFLGLAILRQEINPPALFEEIDALGEKILNKLIETGRERKLIQLFKSYLFLKKLFSLELTRAEFEKASANETELLPVELKAIDSLFQNALHFYRVALKREDAMTKELFSAMQRTKAENAVLVTGGFHSKHFQDFAFAHQLSYLEIAPKMGILESNQKYLRQMLLGVSSTVPQLSLGKVSRPEIRRFGAPYARFLRGELKKVFEEIGPKPAAISDVGLLEQPTAVPPARAEMRADKSLWRQLFGIWFGIRGKSRLRAKPRGLTIRHFDLKDVKESGQRMRNQTKVAYRKNKKHGFVIFADEGKFVLAETASLPQKAAVYSDGYLSCLGCAIRARKGDTEVIGQAHIEAGIRMYMGNMATWVQYQTVIDYLTDPQNGYSDIQIILGYREDFPDFNRQAIQGFIAYAEEKGIRVRLIQWSEEHRTEILATLDRVYLRQTAERTGRFESPVPPELQILEWSGISPDPARSEAREGREQPAVRVWNWGAAKWDQTLKTSKKIRSVISYVIPKGEPGRKKAAVEMITTNFAADWGLTNLVLKPLIVLLSGAYVVFSENLMLSLSAAIGAFVLLNIVGGLVRLFVIYPIFKFIVFPIQKLPNTLHLSGLGLWVNFIPHIQAGNLAPLFFVYRGFDMESLFSIRDMLKISELVEDSVSNYTDAPLHQKQAVLNHSIEIAKAIYDRQADYEGIFNYRRFKIRGTKDYENAKIVRLITRRDLSDQYSLRYRFWRAFLKAVMRITSAGYRRGTRPILLFGTRESLKAIKDGLMASDVAEEHLLRTFYFDIGEYAAQVNHHHSVDVPAAAFIRPMFDAQDMEMIDRPGNLLTLLDQDRWDMLERHFNKGKNIVRLHVSGTNDEIEALWREKQNLFPNVDDNDLIAVSLDRFFSPRKRYERKLIIGTKEQIESHIAHLWRDKLMPGEYGDYVLILDFSVHPKAKGGLVYLHNFSAHKDLQRVKFPKVKKTLERGAFLKGIFQSFAQKLEGLYPNYRFETVTLSQDEQKEWPLSLWAASVSNWVGEFFDAKNDVNSKKDWRYAELQGIEAGGWRSPKLEHFFVGRVRDPESSPSRSEARNGRGIRISRRQFWLLSGVSTAGLLLPGFFFYQKWESPNLERLRHSIPQKSPAAGNRRQNETSETEAPIRYVLVSESYGLGTEEIDLLNIEIDTPQKKEVFQDLVTLIVQDYLAQFVGPGEFAYSNLERFLLTKSGVIVLHKDVLHPDEADKEFIKDLTHTDLFDLLKSNMTLFRGKRDQVLDYLSGFEENENLSLSDFRRQISSELEDEFTKEGGQMTLETVLNLIAYLEENGVVIPPGFPIKDLWTINQLLEKADLGLVDAIHRHYDHPRASARFPVFYGKPDRSEARENKPIRILSTIKDVLKKTLSDSDLAEVTMLNIDNRIADAAESALARGRLREKAFHKIVMEAVEYHYGNSTSTAFVDTLHGILWPRVILPILNSTNRPDSAKRAEMRERRKEILEDVLGIVAIVFAAVAAFYGIVIGYILTWPKTLFGPPPLFPYLIGEAIGLTGFLAAIYPLFILPSQREYFEKRRKIRELAHNIAKDSRFNNNDLEALFIYAKRERLMDTKRVHRISDKAILQFNRYHYPQGIKHGDKLAAEILKRAIKYRKRSARSEARQKFGKVILNQHSQRYLNRLFERMNWVNERSGVELPLDPYDSDSDYQNAVVFTALDSNKKMIGYAWLNVHPEKTPYLSLLAVAENWQSHGIGHELLKQTLEHLRSMGLGNLALAIDPVTETNVGFYRNFAQQEGLQIVRWDPQVSPRAYIDIEFGISHRAEARDAEEQKAFNEIFSQGVDRVFTESFGTKKFLVELFNDDGYKRIKEALGKMKGRILKAHKDLERAYEVARRNIDQAANLRTADEIVHYFEYSGVSPYSKSPSGEQKRGRKLSPQTEEALANVPSFIIFQFESEPSRVDMPSQKFISTILGVSESTLAYHYSDILDDLRFEIEKPDFNPVLKSRIESALKKRGAARSEAREHLEYSLAKAVSALKPYIGQVVELTVVNNVYRGDKRFNQERRIRPPLDYEKITDLLQNIEWTKDDRFPLSKVVKITLSSSSQPEASYHIFLSRLVSAQHYTLFGVAPVVSVEDHEGLKIVRISGEDTIAVDDDKDLIRALTSLRHGNVTVSIHSPGFSVLNQKTGQRERISVQDEPEELARKIQDALIISRSEARQREVISSPTKLVTRPGRLNLLFKRVIQDVQKRRLRQNQAPHAPIRIVYVGLGDQGSPTFFDLAGFASEAFESAILYGVDHDQTVLNQFPAPLILKDAIKKNVDIKILYGDFNKGINVKNADLIIMANVLRYYDDSERGFGISRLQESLADDGLLVTAEEWAGANRSTDIEFFYYEKDKDKAIFKGNLPLAQATRSEAREVDDKSVEDQVRDFIREFKRNIVHGIRADHPGDKKLTEALRQLKQDDYDGAAQSISDAIDHYITSHRFQRGNPLFAPLDQAIDLLRSEARESNFASEMSAIYRQMRILEERYSIDPLKMKLEKILSVIRAQNHADAHLYEWYEKEQRRLSGKLAKQQKRRSGKGKSRSEARKFNNLYYMLLIGGSIGAIAGLFRGVLEEAGLSMALMVTGASLLGISAAILPFVYLIYRITTKFKRIHGGKQIDPNILMEQIAFKENRAHRLQVLMQHPLLEEAVERLGIEKRKEWLLQLGELWTRDENELKLRQLLSKRMIALQKNWANMQAELRFPSFIWKMFGLILRVNRHLNETLSLQKDVENFEKEEDERIIDYDTQISELEEVILQIDDERGSARSETRGRQNQGYGAFIARDAMIDLYDQFFLYHPRQSFFKPRIFEKIPQSIDMEKKSEAFQMIQEGLAYLRKRALEIHSDEILDRLERFEATTTIVGVDVPTIYFISYEDAFPSLLVLSYRYRTIFISKRFLESLDPGSEVDQARVATYLNRAQILLETLYETAVQGLPSGKAKSDEVKSRFESENLLLVPSHISVEMMKRTSELKKQDRILRADLVKTGILNQQHILRDLASIDQKWKEAEQMWKEASQEFEITKDPIEAIVNWETALASWEKSQGGEEKNILSRNHLRNTADNLAKLALHYQSIGNYKKARFYYREAIRSYKRIQFIDRKGLLPIQIQVSIVFLLLRAGMLDEFLREFHTLLTGEGFPRRFSPDEIIHRDAHLVEWLQNHRYEFTHRLNIHRAEHMMRNKFEEAYRKYISEHRSEARDSKAKSWVRKHPIIAFVSVWVALGIGQLIASWLRESWKEPVVRAPPAAVKKEIEKIPSDSQLRSIPSPFGDQSPKFEIPSKGDGKHPPEIKLSPNVRHLTDAQLKQIIKAFEDTARMITQEHRQPNLLSVKELIQSLNPEFKTRIPDAMLRVAEAKEFMQLFMEARWQIFIPRGQHLDLPVDFEKFLMQIWRIDETSWQFHPYLDSFVWTSEGRPLQGFREGNPAFTVNRFVFVDPADIRNVAVRHYREVKSDPQFAQPKFPVPHALQKLILEHNISEEDFVRAFVHLTIKHELRHAKDFAFAELLHHKNFYQDITGDVAAVESILKPNSFIRRLNWSWNLTWSSDLYRKAIPIKELSGQTASLVGTMDELMNKDRHDLAYALFLYFLRWKISETVQFTERHPGDLTLQSYRQTGYFFQQSVLDLPPFRGKQIKNWSEVLDILTTGRDLKGTAQASRDLVDQVYQMHFLTDQERENLLSSRSEARLPDSSTISNINQKDAQVSSIAFQSRAEARINSLPQNIRNYLNEYYSKVRVLADIQDEAIDRETLSIDANVQEGERYEPIRVFLIEHGNETTLWYSVWVTNLEMPNPKILAYARVFPPVNGVFQTEETDVRGNFRNQAIMQRAITLLILKSEMVKGWRSGNALSLRARRMYERMSEDKRLKHTVKSPLENRGDYYFEPRSETRQKFHPGDTFQLNRKDNDSPALVPGESLILKRDAFENGQTYYLTARNQYHWPREGWVVTFANNGNTRTPDVFVYLAKEGPEGVTLIHSDHDLPFTIRQFSPHEINLRSSGEQSLYMWQITPKRIFEGNPEKALELATTVQTSVFGQAQRAQREASPGIGWMFQQIFNQIDRGDYKGAIQTIQELKRKEQIGHAEVNLLTQAEFALDPYRRFLELFTVLARDLIEGEENAWVTYRTDEKGSRINMVVPTFLFQDRLASFAEQAQSVHIQVERIEQSGTISGMTRYVFYPPQDLFERMKKSLIALHRSEARMGNKVLEVLFTHSEIDDQDFTAKDIQKHSDLKLTRIHIDLQLAYYGGLVSRQKKSGSRRLYYYRLTKQGLALKRSFLRQTVSPLSDFKELQSVSYVPPSKDAAHEWFRPWMQERGIADYYIIYSKPWGDFVRLTLSESPKNTVGIGNIAFRIANGITQDGEQIRALEISHRYVDVAYQNQGLMRIMILFLLNQYPDVEYLLESHEEIDDEVFTQSVMSLYKKGIFASEPTKFSAYPFNFMDWPGHEAKLDRDKIQDQIEQWKSRSEARDLNHTERINDIFSAVQRNNSEQKINTRIFRFGASGLVGAHFYFLMPVVYEWFITGAGGRVLGPLWGRLAGFTLVMGVIPAAIVMFAFWLSQKRSQKLDREMDSLIAEYRTLQTEQFKPRSEARAKKPDSSKKAESEKPTGPFTPTSFTDSKGSVTHGRFDINYEVQTQQEDIDFARIKKRVEFRLRALVDRLTPRHSKLFRGADTKPFMEPFTPDLDNSFWIIFWRGATPTAYEFAVIYGKEPPPEPGEKFDNQNPLLKDAIVVGEMRTRSGHGPHSVRPNRSEARDLNHTERINDIFSAVQRNNRKQKINTRIFRFGASGLVGAHFYFLMPVVYEWFITGAGGRALGPLWGRLAGFTLVMGVIPAAIAMFAFWLSQKRSQKLNREMDSLIAEYSTLQSEQFKPRSEARAIIKLNPNANPEPKAVLFDLDGTLTDTLNLQYLNFGRLHYWITLATANEPTKSELVPGKKFLDETMGRLSTEQIRTMIERALERGHALEELKKVLEQLAEKFRIEEKVKQIFANSRTISIDKLVLGFAIILEAALLEAILKNPPKLLPGVVDFIQTLRRRGIFLYVGTGTFQSVAETILKTWNVDQYFAGLYGSLTDRSSPFPRGKADMLELLKQKHGLLDHQVIIFGDGKGDMEAAGGKFIAVGLTRNHPGAIEKLTNAGADFLIPALKNWKSFQRILGFSVRSEARDFEKDIKMSVKLEGDEFKLSLGTHEFIINDKGAVWEIMDGEKREIIEESQRYFLNHIFLTILTLMQEAPLTSEVKSILHRKEVHYTSITSEAVLSLGDGAPSKELANPEFHIDYDRAIITTPNGNRVELDADRGVIKSIRNKESQEIAPLSGEDAQRIQTFMIKTVFFLPAFLNSETREEAANIYDGFMSFQYAAAELFRLIQRSEARETGKHLLEIRSKIEEFKDTVRVLEMATMEEIRSDDQLSALLVRADFLQIDIKRIFEQFTKDEKRDEAITSLRDEFERNESIFAKLADQILQYDEKMKSSEVYLHIAALLKKTEELIRTRQFNQAEKILAEADEQLSIALDKLNSKDMEKEKQLTNLFAEWNRLKTQIPKDARSEARGEGVSRRWFLKFGSGSLASAATLASQAAPQAVPLSGDDLQAISKLLQLQKYWTEEVFDDPEYGPSEDNYVWAEEGPQEFLALRARVKAIAARFGENNPLSRFFADQDTAFIEHLRPFQEAADREEQAVYMKDWDTEDTRSLWVAMTDPERFSDWQKLYRFERNASGLIHTRISAWDEFMKAGKAKISVDQTVENLMRRVVNPEIERAYQVAVAWAGKFGIRYDPSVKTKITSQISEILHSPEDRQVYSPVENQFNDKASELITQKVRNAIARLNYRIRARYGKDAYLIPEFSGRGLKSKADMRKVLSTYWQNSVRRSVMNRIKSRLQKMHQGGRISQDQVYKALDKLSGMSLRDLTKINLDTFASQTQTEYKQTRKETKKKPRPERKKLPFTRFLEKLVLNAKRGDLELGIQVDLDGSLKGVWGINQITGKSFHLSNEERQQIKWDLAKAQEYPGRVYRIQIPKGVQLKSLKRFLKLTTWWGYPPVQSENGNVIVTMPRTIELPPLGPDALRSEARLNLVNSSTASSLDGGVSKAKPRAVAPTPPQVLNAGQVIAVAVPLAPIPAVPISILTRTDVARSVAFETIGLDLRSELRAQVFNTLFPPLEGKTESARADMRKLIYENKQPITIIPVVSANLTEEELKGLVKGAVASLRQAEPTREVIILVEGNNLGTFEPRPFNRIMDQVIHESGVSLVEARSIRARRLSVRLMREFQGDFRGREVVVVGSSSARLAISGAINQTRLLTDRSLDGSAFTNAELGSFVAGAPETLLVSPEDQKHFGRDNEGNWRAKSREALSGFAAVIQLILERRIGHERTATAA